MLSGQLPRRMSVLVAICAASPAIAIPIFGGPNFNLQTSSGYVNADLESYGQSAVTNDGLAIGEAVFKKPSLADGGLRPMRWSPTGWNSLPIGPGTAAGFHQGHVRSINASSTAVGDARYFDANNNSLGYHAMRWNGPNSAAEMLPTLGATSSGASISMAMGVNAAGTAVGKSSKYVGTDFRGDRAVRWAANTGTLLELNVLTPQSGTGYLQSEARDINAAGVAVGVCETYNGSTQLGTRAVRWNAAGAITALGTLGTNPGGITHGQAIGIDESGVVAALVSEYDASHVFVGERAVRYAPNSTTAVELGGLGGTDINGYTTAIVRSISDHGLILGQQQRFLLTQSIGMRPVFWTTTGSTAATELPGLGTNGGISNGIAHGANALDVVVGRVEKYTNNVLQGNRAVVWTTSGGLSVIDLNTKLPANSGWVLTEAYGISDTGFVTGVGQFDPDGAAGMAAYDRLFSMLVPEAGTYGKGDANFDAQINFNDLLILAKHFNQANTTQTIDVADFDLNGATDFNDLLALARNYGTAASFEADWALAQTLVPEPACLVAIMLGAAWTRRVR